MNEPSDKGSNPRIVIVGGGSRQWTPKLLLDIARTESLSHAHVLLHDINPSRLPLLERYAWVMKQEMAPDMTFEATTQLSKGLEGADFVIVTISTGGLDAMAHDLAIPKRYGIFQTVGDTVGPGGVLRALRNIPVLLGIAHEMERSCPDAWLLNLTNPMSALCRAVTRETRVKLSASVMNYQVPCSWFPSSWG
jgi:alpha-galactosidase/6-phospho-beta-glucosidase family protein